MTQNDFYNTLCERHGAAVQEKISSARVAIAGLGGLGSNIAVNLARLGVGELMLVDFDKVEPSNLNRQYYFTRHLGHYKTDALSEIIRELNPYVLIEPLKEKVTTDNIKTLFFDEKILCEAFDLAENKAMLVGGVLADCPNTVIVSGSGMAGYSSANNITTHKCSERLFICGDMVSDIESTNGLMAPRVAICAGHQTNMILRLILGINEV